LADEGEGRIFTENRGTEDPAFFDKLVGQVLFVDAHGYGGWFGGYLEDSISDLCVQSVALSGSDNIHAIADFI
jgi:hypothetical protein